MTTNRLGEILRDGDRYGLRYEHLGRIAAINFAHSRRNPRFFCGA